MRPTPARLALLVPLAWLGLLQQPVLAQVPDHAPAAVPATTPQAADVPVADASDWGTDSVVPPDAPAPLDDAPRAPAPNRATADVQKREDHEEPTLTLQDDPPAAGPDDDPAPTSRDDEHVAARAHAAAVMPAAASSPASDAALAALARVLVAEDDGEAIAAAPEHVERVLSTLADVRSDHAAPPAAASHAERILSTLSDVLSGEAAPATPAPAHAQRVLRTLASVLDAGRRTGAERLQERAPALDAAALDQVRGGFVTESGLHFSFGVEKAVYVNGALVATTRLNLASSGATPLGHGAAAPAASAGVALLQSGTATFTPANTPGPAIGTVIQNSLDNQSLQSVTTVNATVNSLAILRSINTQANLRSAIVDSLRH